MSEPALPEPVAWRYVPSEVWGDQVLTQDPKTVRLAREYGREVEGLYTADQLRAALAAQAERHAAALRTLENLGYTNAGGLFWKPPIGKAPNFDLIDALRADAERYRWLLENCGTWSWVPSNSYPEKVVGFAHAGTGYCDFTLDAAIDAAMGAARKDGQ